jgi:hypothetical protein
MLRKVLIGALAVAGIAVTGFAQGKPDFSGTWKLNVGKSDFGPVPGPSAQTDVIEQSGQTLKIAVNAETEMGKMQYTETLTTDGREVTIAPDAPGAHPNPEVTLQSISAAWNGSTLDVSQKLTYGSDPVTGVSHYTLSADGKVLTISSDYQSQMGEAERTFVFEKQDASAGAPTADSMASSAPSMGSAPTGSSSSSSAASSSMSSGSMSSAMAAASGSASAKPNLSGTWVLDPSKSDFGQMPGPSSATDVIDHKEPSVKISVKQTNAMGDMAFAMELVDDGQKVSTWQIFGSEAKSTAHWDGDTLVVTTDATIQDNAIKIASRYTLSPDGNTLTVRGHMSGPMGEVDTKAVYAKK